MDLITTPLIIVLVVFLAYKSVFTVKQKTAVVIERLGKFQRIAQSGLQFKIPFIDQKSGVVNLRVRELPVNIETKTKDDVFVNLIVSVQYFVTANAEGIRKAFYQFDNPEAQIQSYVFDSIRSEVPKLILDDVFSEKDKIAVAVQNELAETISGFGYEIVKALVTDIDPDAKVKNSMNEINAAKRLKEAAKEYAEAEKIKVVAAAEAEAESKKLQGGGDCKSAHRHRQRSQAKCGGSARCHGRGHYRSARDEHALYDPALRYHQPPGRQQRQHHLHAVFSGYGGRSTNRDPVGIAGGRDAQGSQGKSC